MLARVEGRVQPLHHVPHAALADPRVAAGVGQQPHRAAEQLGGRVGFGHGVRRGLRLCTGGHGVGFLRGSGGRRGGHQAVVVAELVAALGPMPVGGAAHAHAHQRAARGLDALRHRHEIAVAADDHHRLDMAEAVDVFRRVQAQPDVGAVLGRCAWRKQLHQLHPALQQRVAVAAVELPVAVPPVDRHRPERGRELHDRLHVDQRLLQLEAPVGPAVGALAVAVLEKAGMQVLEIPVKGDGAVVIAVGTGQGGFSKRGRAGGRLSRRRRRPSPQGPKAGDGGGIFRAAPGPTARLRRRVQVPRHAVRSASCASGGCTDRRAWPGRPKDVASRSRIPACRSDAARPGVSGTCAQ